MNHSSENTKLYSILCSTYKSLNRRKTEKDIHSNVHINRKPVLRTFGDLGLGLSKVITFLFIKNLRLTSTTTYVGIFKTYNDNRIARFFIVCLFYIDILRYTYVHTKEDYYQIGPCPIFLAWVACVRVCVLIG